MTRKENNTENKILSCLESSGGIQFQENSIFFSSPISLPCLLETLEEGCWDPKNSSNVWNLRVLSSCLRKGRRGNPTERPCAYERAVSETTLVLNEVANSVYLGGKVKSEVAQSCDPMDCSLPGSSVHGIFQARILERVAISFSRGSSRPRDQTQVSCMMLYRLSYQGSPIWEVTVTYTYWVCACTCVVCAHMYVCLHWGPKGSRRVQSLKRIWLCSLREEPGIKKSTSNGWPFSQSKQGRRQRFFPLIGNDYLRASLAAQTVKNLPAMQETWVQSLGQEDPLEKRMASHSSILA